MITEIFILKALIMGIMIALPAGPLGSIIIWQKMSYFCESLAHISLLAIAVSMLLNINMSLAIIIFVLATTLLFSRNSYGKLSADNILGVVAHGSIAIGIVIISTLNQRVRLESYLFGDILAITNHDLYFVSCLSVITIAVIAYFWDKIILYNINAEIAIISFKKIKIVRLILTCLISLLIAMSIKIVGVILIGTILIIPATAANFFQLNPNKMVILSSILGIIAVLIGIPSSIILDLPTGPMIGVITVIIVIITKIISIMK